MILLLTVTARLSFLNPAISAPAKFWDRARNSDYRHGAEQTSAIASMSEAELSKRSQRDMQQYYKTGKADTAHSYEIFRRALAEQNEVAWATVTELYHGMVKSWVLKHSKFEETNEEADYFVNRAFERLWRYVACKPGKFAQFSELPAILQYLKLCTHASVADDARDLSVPTLPIDSEDGRLHPEIDGRLSEDAHPCDDIAQNELWQKIETYLTDDAERIVFLGFFVEGLKNRELLTLHPDLFEDAKQISNKRTVILRRLSRNSEFMETLQEFFYADRDRSGALVS